MPLKSLEFSPYPLTVSRVSKDLSVRNLNSFIKKRVLDSFSIIATVSHVLKNGEYSAYVNKFFESKG